MTKARAGAGAIAGAGARAIAGAVAGARVSNKRVRPLRVSEALGGRFWKPEGDWRTLKYGYLYRILFNTLNIPSTSINYVVFFDGIRCTLYLVDILIRYPIGGVGISGLVEGS